MKYGIFYNRQAGDGLSKKIAKLSKQMIEEAKHEGILISGSSLEESIRLLKKILPKINVLLVIGGDGTLNVAMSIIIEMEHPLPFGIIPAGTINNFASYYNLPTQPEKALEMILNNSQLKKVGIAKCGNNQAIASSLTFGNLADIGNEVRQKDKKKFGKIVYLFQAFKYIGKNKSYEIEYTIDDEKKILKTWFALITTTPSIASFIYDEEAPNQLHLSLLNNIHFRQVFNFLYFSITGRLRKSKYVPTFQTGEIKVKSVDGKQVTVRIDGDKGPDLPLTITYLPNYLPLLVAK